jgi:hypothetical protein
LSRKPTVSRQPELADKLIRIEGGEIKGFNLSASAAESAE